MHSTISLFGCYYYAGSEKRALKARQKKRETIIKHLTVFLAYK